jgi:DNA-binding NarL/FixJ family response regulator
MFPSARSLARLIRVLVVDDHPLMREGIASAIEDAPDMEVVGGAADGAEAFERFQSLHPDVTLMDLQMPNLAGVEAIAAIRAECPSARVLVLTTYGGDALAERALRSGAMGFLLKSTLHRELLDAIRAVHAGRRYVPAVIADEIVTHMGDERLSERELEVLHLVADGLGNKGVGRALAISEQTVKAHLKSIFAKLGVADRTHAVTVALRRGIIEI